MNWQNLCALSASALKESDAPARASRHAHIAALPLVGRKRMLRGMPGFTSDSMLIFRVGEKEFALGVAVIERVAQVVQINPFPNAPRGVRGTVNVQGRTVPVFDLTSRPDQPVRAGDFLIIARTPRRPVALLVESIGAVGPALGEGLVVIHDLEHFLARPDRAALAHAP